MLNNISPYHKNYSLKEERENSKNSKNFTSTLFFECHEMSKVLDSFFFPEGCLFFRAPPAFVSGPGGLLPCEPSLHL